VQLGIGEAQKEGMRSMAPKDKWVLICQNSKASNEKGDEETPQRYVYSAPGLISHGMLQVH